MDFYPTRVWMDQCDLDNSRLENKIKQFIKDHIIDKCPEEYDDIF